MEVISGVEAAITLKFLADGLVPEKAVSEILAHHRFYSPAGVRRDVERVRVKFEDAKRNAGEMF